LNITNSLHKTSILVLVLLFGITGTIIPGSVEAKPIQRSLCVFDIVGTNGPVFSNIKKYRTAALQWGVKLNLKAYTDEAVALEDFQAGQCDGVVLTGIRNRKLIKFAGSLDMMGASPTYEHQKKAIQALSRPKAEPLLQTEKYEVAGIFPAGAVYFYARPELMQKIEGTPEVGDLAGQKIATLSYDQQAVTAIRKVGGTVVGADITSFSGMFNNGSVDLIYAPVGAYQALELYKGLGEKGRIIDFTLSQLSYQITLRRDRFPDEFGQKSREWAASQFDRVVKRHKKDREKIPDKYWVEIPEKKKVEYNSLMRRVRQDLEKQGIYHPKMVGFLRNIRCKMDPSRAECTM
jgi:hypothetical protein